MQVSASILSADFSQLGQEINDVTLAGADYIHFDVMDGNFVNNITIGSCVLSSLRQKTSAIFDVHLMVQNPLQHIKNFADAGADWITIQYESENHVSRALKYIQSLGKKSGIALNPSTNESNLEYILEYVDIILIMSVNPGFGGQTFIYNQLNKITKIRNIIDHRNLDIKISIDGGVNNETATLVKSAGADIVVSGSFIFNANPQEYHIQINKLR